jgi:hypothetical protein
MSRSEARPYGCPLPNTVESVGILVVCSSVAWDGFCSHALSKVARLHISG